MPSIPFEIGEALSGSVEYSGFVNRVYVGEGMRELGTITIHLLYKCHKYIGKCVDRSVLEPDVEVIGSDDIEVALDIKQVDFAGKLEVRQKGRTSVELAVRSGRGQGEAKITFALSALSPRAAGDYKIRLAFYYGSVRGERKILGDIVESRFLVVKPVTIIKVSTEPRADYYVLGDAIRLNVEIASEYKGALVVECGGALKRVASEHSIEPGVQVLSVDTAIVSSIDELGVSVSVPELKFVEQVLERIEVRRQRVLVDPHIEISSPQIGKEACVVVRVENASRVSRSAVSVKASIYGFVIQADEVLSPGEQKRIELRTSILTSRNAQYLEGELTVYEKISNQVQTFSLELPRPQRLPVELNVRSTKIELTTNMLGRMIIDVANNSELDIGIVLLKSPLKLCIVHEGVLGVVRPFELREVEVELKPLAIGNEKAVLALGIVSGGVVVEEVSCEVEVSVRRSFIIRSIRMVHPSTSKLAVKNQRVVVELLVETSCEKVSIHVRSSDIDIKENTIEVYFPGSPVVISGKLIGYRDSIRILLSDGLMEEEVVLPIKVTHPYLEYNVSRATEFFVGVENNLVLSISNPFEVPLHVKIKVDKEANVVVDQEEVSARVEQLGKVDVKVSIVGLSEGEGVIRLRISSEYVDEEIKAAVDSWSCDQDLKIYFHKPIYLEVLSAPKLMLPSPIPSDVRDVYASCSMDVLVRNLSEMPLLEVSLEPRIEEVDVVGSIDVQPRAAMLLSKSERRFKTHISIPVIYRRDSVKMRLVARVGSYAVDSKLVEIHVHRYAYSVVEVGEDVVDEDRCSYPKILHKGGTLILIPLTEDVEACGKPSALSAKNHAVMSLLYRGLSESLGRHETPWDIAALLLFKKAMGDADFKRELGKLRDMTYSERGVILIPLLAWSLAIESLAGYSPISKAEIAKIVEDLENVGLIHVDGSPLNKANKPTYYHLFLNYALSGSGRWSDEIRSRILNSIKSMQIDPLYLLYIIRGEKGVGYDEVSSVVEKLFSENRYGEFLMCVALTDAPLTSNIDILLKLERSLNEILGSGSIRRSTLLALSVIFSKITAENIERLRGVVNRE